MSFDGGRDCPEVTVAMPVYKAEYFEVALRSALNQDFDSFEILVCDDSRNGLIEAIVQRCQRESRVPLRYVRNEQQLFERGNLKRVIELARGRFIKYLFDDDVIALDNMARCAAVLRDHPEVALVSSQRRLIDSDGKELPPTLASIYPFDGDVCLEGSDVVSFLVDYTVNFIGEPSSVMFRREHIQPYMDDDLCALGGEKVYWLGDLTLYVKLLQHGHLAMLKDPLSSFRISPQQASQQARDDPNIGHEGHANFKRLIRELGWYKGKHTLRLRTLSGEQAFSEFDLVEQWRVWLRQQELVQPRPPEPGISNPDQSDGIFQHVETPPQHVNGTPYEAWLKHVHRRLSRPLNAASLPEIHWTVLVGIGGDVAPADEGATQASLSELCPLADRVALVGSDLAGVWTPRANGWTLLLCGGDTLEPDALSLLARAIEQSGRGDKACLVYFDHDTMRDGVLSEPSFKPAFNKELLLSYPYMGRVVAVKDEWLARSLDEWRGLADLEFSYRLALRALMDAGEHAFIRLPAVTAHLNPVVSGVFVETSEAWQALAGVLSNHLQVHVPEAQLLEGPAPGTFHVIHPLTRTPKVSIVIPTRDQLPFLSRCIESLLDKTDYPDFEILVVDNDSQTAEAQAFLSGLEVVDPERIRVLRVPGAFNFSRMNNLAVAQARGEFILLLNNDTAALHADWLSHMMRQALRDGVGIVGARLLYPEGTVQHAGVIMGLRGPAEHPCLGFKADEPGYMFRAQVTQNFSAVTAACMLVSKAVYEEVGGLDEEVFAVSYNDVDFCLRVGRTGRRIVWTPLATLLHEGSASQKASIETLSSDKKAARFTREQAAMYERWPDVIANDPAYNPNLTLVERGYEVETNPLLCHDPLKGLVDHRVVAFAADPHGCGHYRILQPMQAMLDAGLCTGGASPELFGPHLALRSGADTLVFQRPFTDANLSLLESLLPLKNVLKVYEVDDDLSRVPMKNSHRDQIPKDIRARMMRNIGVCDRLVVSTEFLAHQFRGANGDIRVVQNRLPRALWGNAPPARVARDMAGRKPVVGWAGGVSHQGDLELIAQVVKETADQVDWVFMGMCPEPIRPYVKAFHTGVPTPDYPKRLMEITRDWDLAVAPLELNAFNEAKSNLRLLEYGWCGLPVICTDITPYQCDLPAVRVKNRFKDWRAAILDAVNDLPATRLRGQELQARVEADWMLEGRHLEAWYRAWTDR